MGNLGEIQGLKCHADRHRHHLRLDTVGHRSRRPLFYLTA